MCSSRSTTCDSGYSTLFMDDNVVVQGTSEMKAPWISVAQKEKPIKVTGPRILAPVGSSRSETKFRVAASI
jgi:hypothetical protein